MARFERAKKFAPIQNPSAAQTPSLEDPLWLQSGRSWNLDERLLWVDMGSKLVDQAGKTMAEVVSSVKHVTDIMSEITAASREQSMGIEQVNQAIALMDEATQQNAALVEEAAAAAESLRDQASGLVQIVSVFKLNAQQRNVVSAGLPNAIDRPATKEGAALKHLGYRPAKISIATRP